ncbi:unnamed protein product [Moneuplotes crassus]|uniref:Uncharacterized protein n=1 Tax=Euplotes crassus TaxID=5936 RepID=A0A7S3KD00_EUPCR|nr:unnamed protein product [Moneuplotes crassus]|mmetsp:Transcript_16904/g.16566  ORF Transcript_16904/g.16566 Transcript_16904/m.16566 type:complete len:131 (+) Transcript_16904:15-407(+)
MDASSGETSGKVSMSGSLKMKLNALENAMAKIIEEIKFQKREVQQLRSEKETLEKVLESKAIEVKKSIEDDVVRCNSDMRQKFSESKSLNNKLQQEITGLKQEKTTIQQNVLHLQRKIGELELTVGQQGA